MALVRGTQIPTIDVVLVTIKPYKVGANEIAIDTANQIGVTPAIETTDKVALIVKGKLIAQKPARNTVTGNTIVLTDNTFSPEEVKILQGGTIKYDNEDTTKIVGYVPPVAGSDEEGELFQLIAYSAIYNAAGKITGYEKITYPNCQGTPVSLNSQDDTFRAPEYTINSAPDNGEAPYVIDYISELPVVG